MKKPWLRYVILSSLSFFEDEVGALRRKLNLEYEIYRNTHYQIIHDWLLLHRNDT